MEIEDLNKVNNKDFWPVILLCFFAVFLVSAFLFYSSHSQNITSENNISLESQNLSTTNEQLESKGILKDISIKITDGVSKIFSSNKTKESENNPLENTEQNAEQSNLDNLENIENQEDLREPDTETYDLTEGNYKQIVAGLNHTCVLFKDGKVKCWGDNTYGQLGDGTIANKTFNQAKIITNLTNVSQITAGNNFNCALLDNKKVKCWGVNKEIDSFTQKAYGGALGQGACDGLSSTDPEVVYFYNKMGYNCDLNYSAVPLEVPSKFLNNVVKIEANSLGVCALLENKTVKCWGRGVLAIGGDVSNQSSFYPIEIPNLGLVKDISIGDPICVVLENLVDAHIQDTSTQEYTLGTDNSNVKCWGDTYGGNLFYSGNIIPGVVVGSQTAAIPIAIPINNVKQVKDTCALFNDGKIGCWGRTDGYGSSETLIEPIIYIDSSDVKKILGGNINKPSLFSTCVLTTENKIKCFGVSVENNSVNFNLLVPKTLNWITGDLKIDDLSTGYQGQFPHNNEVAQHTCILKDNGGNIQCRGRNDFGQLGYCTTLEFTSGSRKIPYSSDLSAVGLDCPEVVEDTNTTEEESIPDTNVSNDFGTPTLELASPRPRFAFGGGLIKIINICNGCSIWYTLDGTNPTSENKLVASKTNNEIIISSYVGAEILENGNPITIKVKAVKENQESETVSKTYYLPEVPEFNSGNYTSNVNAEVLNNPQILPYNAPITIIKPTSCPECKLYYCLNCSEQTNPSTGLFLPEVEIKEYLSPIELKENIKISVYSVSTDGLSSNLINSANYKVLSAPSFSQEATTVSSGTKISLSLLENGYMFGDIYYTLDNTEPTINSTRYTQPISIYNNTTIKAKAINLYGMESQTITKTYTTQANTISESQFFTDITESFQNNYGLATHVFSNPLVSDGTKEYVVAYTQNQPGASTKQRLVLYRFNIYSQEFIEKKEIFLNFKNNSWTNFSPIDVYQLSNQEYLVVGDTGIKKINFTESTNALTGVVWDYNFFIYLGQNTKYAGIKSELDSENNLFFTGRIYPNLPEILLLKMNVNSNISPTEIWNKTFTASCESAEDGNPHSCYSSYQKSNFLINGSSLIFYYLNNGTKVLNFNKSTGATIWDLNLTTYLKSLYPNALSLIKGASDLIYTDFNSTNYISHKISNSGNINWTTVLQLPATQALAPIIMSEQNRYLIFSDFSENSSSVTNSRGYFILNTNTGQYTSINLPHPIFRKKGNLNSHVIKKMLYNSDTQEFIHLFLGRGYSGVVYGEEPHINIFKIDSQNTPYAFFYPLTTNYNYYSQYGYPTQAIDAYIKNNKLFILGQSNPHAITTQYTNNKIFISISDLVDSKLPVIDYLKEIELNDFGYSFNRDIYWSDPEMIAKPNVHLELLPSNYAILFLPNLRKEETEGLATMLSIVNLEDAVNKNNFKITAPNTLTPVLCEDGINYCISFDLSLTQNASIAIYPSNKDLSVITNGNFTYYNNLDTNPKITKHWKLNEISGTTTHNIKTNYSGEYYLNIYTYDSSQEPNTNINKRQYHKIKVNSIN